MGPERISLPSQSEFTFIRQSGHVVSLAHDLVLLPPPGTLAERIDGLGP